MSGLLSVLGGGLMAAAFWSPERPMAGLIRAVCADLAVYIAIKVFA